MKNKNRNARFGAVFGRIVLFGFLVVLFAADTSAAPQVDIKELTAKAEAGDGEAQLKLGACYYQGRGIPKDYEKAVYWWKKSAEGGIPAAQYFLGACYARGNGIEKDEKKAVELYQRAAEAGFALAQFDLAMAYKSGLGGDPPMPGEGFLLDGTFCIPGICSCRVISWRMLYRRPRNSGGLCCCNEMVPQSC